MDKFYPNPKRTDLSSGVTVFLAKSTGRSSQVYREVVTPAGGSNEDSEKHKNCSCLHQIPLAPVPEDGQLRLRSYLKRAILNKRRLSTVGRSLAYHMLPIYTT